MVLTIKVRPHGQKFSRTIWYNMVVRRKTFRGNVDGMGYMCCATFYTVRPCCVTKIVNRQMAVHFKKNSCDIMISQKCCVLSDVIWTYFCHFLRCSCSKFIKKSWMCGRWSTITFCMTTTRFMSHNLVVQSCMTKLLSMWTYLYWTFFIWGRETRLGADRQSTQKADHSVTASQTVYSTPWGVHSH